MPDELSADDLVGSWMHSHEEDDDGRLVFRKAGYAFPRARGRDGFDLRPGGGLRRMAPGPDDRPAAREGEWSLEGRQLELHLAAQGAVRYEVESVGDDRLVVRRVP